MRILIQRVSQASVHINGKVKSTNKKNGLMLLVGIEDSDTTEDIDFFVQKKQLICVYLTMKTE